MTADARVLLALATLSESAADHASHEAVPDDPRLLASFITNLKPIPLFMHGERVPAWTVDVRKGCAGPAQDAAGKGPGTLIYCLAADGKTAWLTVVAVPLGQAFGPAAVVSNEDPWVQEVHVAGASPAADEPDVNPAPGTEPIDVWQAPTPDEDADSGR
jgi:hypothetical protein